MESKPKKPKKAKKHDHDGGHHGGSWKVAYADFVTAMMAFFLLLWLVNSVSDEKKEALANYFKYFNIIESGGGSVFMDGDQEKGMLEFPGADIMKENLQDDPPGTSQASPQGADSEEVTTDEFIERFKRDVEAKLADMKDQILMKPFEGGLRIEIMDKEGDPMFALGSSEMSPSGKNILNVLNESLADTSHKIALEGHTDARVITSAKYSNWELSTQRASVARKVLESGGLDLERLIRVSGYAATQPLIKNDPYNPRNRRISIVLFESAHAPMPQPQPPPAENPIDEVADTVMEGAVEDYLYKR